MIKILEEVNMNKQQLASKIWESANKMRSKIEANEYKDYILGFIFYKFLSNKELKTLETMHYPKERLNEITEDKESIVKSLQDTNGYFIEYNNLFSTWIEMKSDFNSDFVDQCKTSITSILTPVKKPQTAEEQVNNEGMEEKKGE